MKIDQQFTGNKIRLSILGAAVLLSMAANPVIAGDGSVEFNANVTVAWAMYAV